MPRRNSNVATPRHLAPPVVERAGWGLLGLPTAMPRKPISRRAHRNAARRWTA